MSIDPNVEQSYVPVPINRESVISKAADEIRRLIGAANLKPGDALPVELKLSKSLGISRGSVREALRVLDGLGLVEKQPGRRVIVADRSRLHMPPPIGEAALLKALPVVYKVRGLVEERCAELAAQHRTEGEVAELEGYLALFQEARKRGDPVSAAHNHQAFHAGIVAAARNPVLTALFNEVRFSIAAVAERLPETLRDSRQATLHTAMLEAVRVQDSRRARAAARRHFQMIAPLIEFVTRSGEREGHRV
jgi:GntR family transcriptional regulator, transcriptional repressor for pyruvate dehydrogenase complex